MDALYSMVLMVLDIDWTLEVIDKLRAPLEGRDQEESTIRAEYEMEPDFVFKEILS